MGSYVVEAVTKYAYKPGCQELPLKASETSKLALLRIFWSLMSSKKHDQLLLSLKEGKF